MREILFRGRRMKAWEVKNKYEGFNAEIVFATTAGKAKTIALSISEDNLDDSNFCDLEAHRAPALDKYYKSGKTHMDWCEPNDRLVLVKEYNYYCSDECFSVKECYKCIANKYCQRYKDYVERNKE